MNKIFIIIILLILIAGCASKKPPFDLEAKFKEAEQAMQKEYFEKARNAYKEIQENAPDRSYDPDIMLRIADSYYGDERYDEALVEYQSFLNFHPVNKNAAYAQYQTAMCSYQQLTTIDRDPEITRTALKEFRRLLEKYPRSAYDEQAQRYIKICLDRLSEYELYVGRFYYKKGSYKAALGRFDKLLKDFPGAVAEKDALYYSGLAYMETNERKQALSSFEALVAKYPSMRDSVGHYITTLRTK